MLRMSSRREQALPRRVMMLGVLSHTRCRRVSVRGNATLAVTSRKVLGMKCKNRTYKLQIGGLQLMIEAIGCYLEL
jgi:hypothetical protein